MESGHVLLFQVKSLSRAIHLVWLIMLAIFSFASSVAASGFSSVPVSFAYDGHYQVRMVYDGGFPTIFDYDSAAVLNTGKEANLTSQSRSLFGKFAGFLAAEETAGTFQYSLRANADGFYPVMQRGNSDPVFTTYLQNGDVWKFGTSINPATRYSQSYLNGIGEYGVRMEPEFSGTTAQAVTLQDMKIQNFLLQNGKLPPGNKIVHWGNKYETQHIV